MLKTILPLVTILLCIQVTIAAKDGYCEVCKTVLKKLSEQLGSENRTPESVEAKLLKLCAGVKGPERRFCEYLGAIDNAATRILNKVTKPMSYFKDTDKICTADLKSVDNQICELAYSKEIDWKNVNLKKMRVKELKKILNGWDESCDGCLEKDEFIRKIEELKPKYVPDTKTEL